LQTTQTPYAVSEGGGDATVTVWGYRGGGAKLETTQTPYAVSEGGVRGVTVWGGGTKLETTQSCGAPPEGAHSGGGVVTVFGKEERENGGKNTACLVQKGVRKSWVKRLAGATSSCRGGGWSRMLTYADVC
jgi:hypothetical protein